MKKCSLIIVTGCLAALPALALAATPPAYTTFQDIPFVTGTPNLNGYINALYIAAIGIAAILVVFKLMYAGVKYMFTDVVSMKGQAKEDIKSALLGLLIILGAVTILATINPSITRMTVLDGLERVSGGGGSPPPTPPTPTCPTGQILMACEDDVSLDYQCRYPTELSWCGGTISYPPPATPPPTAGSWTEIAEPFDGNSAAMIAADMENRCRSEGGSPRSKNIGDNIRVVCTR